MVKVVVLDSTPLWLLSKAQTGIAAACTGWADSLLAAGHRLVIPEITDYEVRREFLRKRATRQVRRLDGLRRRMIYAPITTAAMVRAADLWAQARQQGRPTAGTADLDGDMILVAQAEELRLPNAVIATGNVGHISPFFPADLWTNITA